MNTLIKLLNDHGYSNTGDNRSYAIRSLNNLLDAGLLQIEILNHQRHLDGYIFSWEKNGKRYGTLYKLKIFGKRYFGHWMPTKEARYIFGDKIVSKITYNTIDVDEMLLALARIISDNKNGFDFLKEGNCKCSRCCGKGVIPRFYHVANGICFQCCGIGVDGAVLKKYIQDNINQVK